VKYGWFEEMQLLSSLFGHCGSPMNGSRTRLNDSLSKTALPMIDECLD
jgi:hypothetical protein